MGNEGLYFIKYYQILFICIKKYCKKLKSFIFLGDSVLLRVFEVLPLFLTFFFLTFNQDYFLLLNERVCPLGGCL